MFGLDVKTFVITAILLLFVLPWVRTMLLNRTAAPSKAAQ